VRTAVLTAAALVAFAGNSVLCRLALGDGSIDAASFSLLRLASGAAVLLAAGRGHSPVRRARAWASALVLVLYALPFSYAYGLVTTGAGALLLFGSVQATMLVAAWRGGERPGLRQWLGMALAGAGLVALVYPGLAAPPPLGAALMAAAGVCWGLYSLRGRQAGDPVARNAVAFLYAVPLALMASLVALPWLHVSPRGALLAVASGAVTSGGGYVWSGTPPSPACRPHGPRWCSSWCRSWPRPGAFWRWARRSRHAWSCRRPS
jgi:drug/metabolite transporter (DMT)-like permease